METRTHERADDGAEDEQPSGSLPNGRSDLHASYADEPTVTDVRIGVFYTAVEISTGDVGVAFTPRDLGDTVCCPKTAAGAPPAGRLIGIGAWEMARYALAPSPLKRAVGIATLNALSAAAINRYGLPEGMFQEKLDALAAAEFRPSDEVVMVGAFIPFIKTLRGRVAKLRIVDKHAEALKPNERSMWVPPESATGRTSAGERRHHLGLGTGGGRNRRVAGCRGSRAHSHHGGSNDTRLARSIFQARRRRVGRHPSQERQTDARNRWTRRLRVFLRAGR